MVLEPLSTITLYADVDIDLRSGINISFASQQEQAQYFASKVALSQIECYYIKKLGMLQVCAPGTVVKNCNYVSFVNPNFDNKTIYAQIINYDIRNNGDSRGETCYITYYIDELQTNFFDADFESCHIDREHTSHADWVKAETNPYDQSIMEYLTPENNLACNPMNEKNYYANDDVYVLDGDPGNGFATYMGYLIVASTIDMGYLDASASVWVTDTPSTQLKNCFNNILNQDSTYLGTDKEFGFIYSNDFLASDITGGCSQTSGSKLKFSLSFNPAALVPVVDPDLFDIRKVNGFNNAMISNSNEDKSTFGNSFNIYWVGRNGAQKIVDLYNQFGAASCILSIVEMPFVYFAGMFEMTDGNNTYINHLTETFKTSYYRALNNGKYNASMRKLYTFPFSYIRVIATNNDVKEYHYEDFKAVADGGSDCSFGLSTTPIGSTEIACKPLGYKYAFNMEDNLYLRNFPQAPYTTDAFVSYMASVAQSIIANNTLDTRDTIGMSEVMVQNKKFGLASDVLKGAANTGAGLASGNAGLAGGGLMSLFGSKYTKGQADLARSMQDRLAASTADAYNVLAGKNEGGTDNPYDYSFLHPNAVYENYAETKPAYAANLYKGASTGYGAYNKDTNFYPHLTLVHVQLRDEILRKYNDYFKCYGYTSGRFGIPRVIQYMKGSTADANVPHWESVDGKLCTYIKTADCHVTGIYMEAAAKLESMFNAGLRLYKGSALIPSNS